MGGFWAFLQLLVSLSLVLLLAYWCIRYLLPRLHGVQSGRAQAMCIVERVPLGMRSSLCLVRVGERYFLVGLSPGGISSLAEIAADQLPEGCGTMPAVPDMGEVMARSRAGAQKFREQLAEQLERVRERKERGHDDRQP